MLQFQALSVLKTLDFANSRIVIDQTDVDAITTLIPPGRFLQNFQFRQIGTGGLVSIEFGVSNPSVPGSFFPLTYWVRDLITAPGEIYNCNLFVMAPLQTTTPALAFSDGVVSVKVVQPTIGSVVEMLTVHVNKSVPPLLNSGNNNDRRFPFAITTDTFQLVYPNDSLNPNWILEHHVVPQPQNGVVTLAVAPNGSIPTDSNTVLHIRSHPSGQQGDESAYGCIFKNFVIKVPKQHSVFGKIDVGNSPQILSIMGTY